MSIGNAMSDYKQISCGVPQGSVLGPVLILLYVNDFNNSYNQHDFHLFADDSNLFYAHKSLKELETTVNNVNFCTLKFNTEFTIHVHVICPYWRESIGRPRSKSCIVPVPFIDSCKIHVIGEGWWQSARMEIIHKYCIM